MVRTVVYECGLRVSVFVAVYAYVCALPSTRYWHRAVVDLVIRSIPCWHILNPIFLSAWRSFEVRILVSILHDGTGEGQTLAGFSAPDHWFLLHV